MKEKYTKPVSYIDEFKETNILTTSTLINDTNKGDTDNNFGN